MHNLPHRLTLALLTLACGAIAVRADAATRPATGPTGDAKPFDIVATQRLNFFGELFGTDDPGGDRVRYIEFGIIPVRALKIDTWLNPVTGRVEQSIHPAVPHPVPVLRSKHVRLFERSPDLGAIALDQLQKDPGEAEIDPAKPFALIADDNGRTVLLSLNKINVPRDKTSEWRLGGTMQPVTLVEHFDDPVADRGRAVVTKEPLPLTGQVLYGVREQMLKPTTFFALDLKSSTPKQVLDGVIEGRLALNGTVVDRVTFRSLRVTDANGRKLSELEFNDDVNEFAISPDGQRIVYSTERFVDVPNDLPRREIASIIYSVDGKKITEVIGYDDCTFMPDGNLLVTGKGADEGLFVADLKSGKVTPLEIKDGPEDHVKPRWPRTPAVSPDGKWVAYASGQEVYVVGIDGRGWTPVWVTETREPQSAPVFSPDGKFVAMIVTPLNVMHGPGELIVFDLAKRVRQPIPAAKAANSEIPLVWRP